MNTIKMKKHLEKTTGILHIVMRLHLGAVVVSLALVTGYALIVANTVYKELPAAAGAPASTAACTISSKLVNSCRPWLGAAASSYPGVGDNKAQLLAHEQRIGRQLDIVHIYHPPGSTPLSATDKYFATRANTILSVTWKPGGSSNSWASAGGGDASVNATIDAAADSFKSLGATKVMLTIHHEPENDVSGGASGCAPTVYKGSAGTPAEYRAMWQNVRNRFNAKGVNNVVWVMNYMGFSTWDCMVDDLWPGNDLVDWVMWDPYTTNGDFAGMVNRFYNWMQSYSSAAHDFNSKPWGIAEWGSWQQATQDNTYRLYRTAQTTLGANMFPRLKAYQVFDALNTSRISYDKNAAYDQAEVNAYKAFANISQFSNPSSPSPSPAPQPAPKPTPAPKPAPTPAPTPTPTTPSTATPAPIVTSTTGQPVSDASQQTVVDGGLVVFDPTNISDPEKVKDIQKVEYYEGTVLVETVTRPPYALQTSKLTPGQHTLVERTYYLDGSTSEKTQTITLKASAAQQAVANKAAPAYVSWIIGGGAGLVAIATGVFTQAIWMPYVSRIFQFIIVRFTGGGSAGPMPPTFTTFGP
jgi:hypothetical protein